ncbi:MAG: protein phosphatase 2C domain-containing protein [Saprospiraceae bacterium]|nr:protein phosphatase 2C domain-containing protein [Saprospiraceae bacterium]
MAALMEQAASHNITKSIAAKYPIVHLSNPELLIKELILNANAYILTEDGSIKLSASSSTIAMVYLIDKSAFITHIGDSKIIYINRESAQWWSSKDHSFVQELYEAGILESESEMKSHPLRSRITQALSNESLIAEDIIKIKHISSLNTGDVIIICTDGVMEKLTSEEMVALFSNPEVQVSDAFEYLKNMCAETSRDNNTAIVLEF